MAAGDSRQPPAYVKGISLLTTSSNETTALSSVDVYVNPWPTIEAIFVPHEDPGAISTTNWPLM